MIIGRPRNQERLVIYELQARLFMLPILSICTRMHLHVRRINPAGAPSFLVECHYVAGREQMKIVLDSVMTQNNTVLHFREGKKKKRSLMENRTSRPQQYLHTGSSAWMFAIYPSPTYISVHSGQHVGVAHIIEIEFRLKPNLQY